MLWDFEDKQFVSAFEAGNPFYVIDLDQLDQNLALLKSTGCQIAFAVKSCYHPEVLDHLSQSVDYFEVSSLEESQLVESLQKKCILNSPVLTNSEIEVALDLPLLINVQSLAQLELLCESSSTDISIGLRLSADSFPSRFGINWDKEESACIDLLAENKHVQISHLHMHVCEGSRSPEDYVKKYEYLRKIKSTLSEQGHQIDTLNLGGGFFSNMPDELSSQFESPIPGPNDYAGTLNQIANLGEQLIIEPGNILVSDCTSYLTRVEEISEEQILVNGSVFDIAPSKPNKSLPARPILEAKQDRSRQIVGKTCMEDDVLHFDFQYKVEPRNWIKFENCGGYTSSLRPMFIFGRPATLIYSKGVLSNGSARDSREDFRAFHQR